jgi:hypothetical protein
MKAEKQEDGSWLASGEGFDRPILAEGFSRREAVEAFTVVYGNQYAAAQVADYVSMYGLSENDDA